MRLHTWNSGVFFFRVQGVTASTVRYDSFLQGVDFYEHKLSFSCPFFFLQRTRAAFPRAQSSLKCAPWEAVGYKKKLTLCVLHSFHNGRGSWWVLSSQYMMLPSADRRGKRHKFWIFVALFLFLCVFSLFLLAKFIFDVFKRRVYRWFCRSFSSSLGPEPNLRYLSNSLQYFSLLRVGVVLFARSSVGQRSEEDNES